MFHTSNTKRPSPQSTLRSLRRRIRLDTDEQCFSSVRRLSPPSFFSRLHAELNNLPSGVFSVELIPSVPVDDELLSKSGVVLRCRFCQSASPAIPSLRLRVSTRYPTDPPEVLSLTNTLPPKLEFSGEKRCLKNERTISLSLSL